MIPCNHCGTDNPLGTLFCRSCGQRIEVDPSAIMGSVQQSQAEAADAKLLQAGRSALMISGFLLMAALIVSLVMLPKLPPARMPMVTDRSGDRLLPPVGDAASTAPAAVELALGGSSSLIDWRAKNADLLVGSFGTDLEHILGWMQLVLERQKDDGSFLGSDPVVATALSTLALQAWPGDAAAERAAERGREWLRGRFDRIVQQGERRALSLAAMALMEADALDRREIGTLSTLIGSGEHLDWQALMLPLFTDERRPTDTLVLRRALAEDPLWAHYLDRFSPQPLVRGPDKTLFSAAGVVGLDAFQRWLWAQTAWFHAADPETYAATLRSWTAAERPPEAPEPLATLAGPQAGAALAVLAATAPARVPVVRTDPPRK